MKIGEALVYGLLGGTGTAAEHYVTDWRDRVKRTRDSAAEKERQQYQTSEREAGQEYQSAENEKSRTFTTEENQASRSFQSGENEKSRLFQAGQNKENRAFQSSESDKARTFQADQADANVGRQNQIAENQAIITNKYKDPGTQYAVAEDGKTLVPIKPGENGAIPIPVAQMTDGKFSYLTGTSGKGLLKGGLGSSKGAGGYETVKTPAGKQLTTQESTIYRDPDTGQEFQFVRNAENLLVKVPLESAASAPPAPTKEQEAKAEEFAKQTVNELAKTFSTDATDFAPWGGSRKAAQLYFKQNYLNGTALDAEGKLIIPGQVPTAPTAAGTPEQQDAQEQSAQLYQSFTPERQQLVQRFISAMDEGRNPQQLVERMLSMGFTREQLNTLFPGLTP